MCINVGRPFEIHDKVEYDLFDQQPAQLGVPRLAAIEII